MHTHLKRLEQVWVTNPIVCVTTCTAGRRSVLANQQVHEICIEVWRNAERQYGWIVGRYVLMPDHVHFFCAPRRDESPLHTVVGKWKEWTAKYTHRRHSIAVPLWQPEFYDHVLRSFENYEVNWDYVRQNPVRAGLVASADEWTYQGELHDLRFD